MNIKLNKLTDKITAIIVFIVVTELAIGVALGISCMFDYHFYASDRNTYAILETCRVKSESDIEEIVEYCKLYTYEQEGVKLSQLDQNILDRYRINFAEKNTNIRFITNKVFVIDPKKPARTSPPSDTPCVLSNFFTIK